MNKYNIKPGDKIVAVFNELRYTPGHEIVEVLSTGRKWGKFRSRYRFDLETLEIDGGEYSSPGRCYLTMKEYEDEFNRNKEWEKIRLRTGFKCPDHLTLEDVQQISAKVFQK